MPRSTCFSRAISSRRAGKFFKILDSPIGLRMVTRASGELAIAHRPQLAGQGLLRDRSAELFENPLAKIDQPFGPRGVELHHPVANDLKGHAADLGRL